MRIIQIVPGIADSFYCENCLRDNGLIRALRDLGHDAIVVPLYLPLAAAGTGSGAETPIFFGGINVYLQQKLALFRKTPRWLDRIFDSPRLLKWAARRAGMTDPQALAQTMLSMLRGEDGRQAKELARLVDWLAASDRPDVVCLSNALLLGLARRIKKELNVPIICSLQDEDTFIDDLPEPYRQQGWQIIAERADDIDLFIAVSGYYADLMRDRIGLAADRVRVVPVGLDCYGYEPAETPPDPPVIGYLSRMCPERGLETLIEAFVILKSEDRFKGLKLRAAGGKMPEDQTFMDRNLKRLAECGLAGEVEFMPNLDRDGIQRFLPTLSVLSVPTRRGEAFGSYILEALACGVPVVQPRHGAFPELLQATGGGILCEPNDPASLARSIETLLANPSKARELGRRGRVAVSNEFRIENIAEQTVKIYEDVKNNAK